MPGHPRTSEVAGLLLAAGQGSRLGIPKALIEVGGERLADRGVALLREGGTAPVVVVTGAANVAIPGTVTVHNPAWRTGMASSLAAGLGVLPSACQAVVVALVDQPLIGPGIIQRLIGAYTGGASLAVATYHGKPRNPVLLARQHWAGVLAAAAGDTGARPYLRRHPGLVTAVECADIGSPDDIDTPEDLDRVQRLLAGQGAARA